VLNLSEIFLLIFGFLLVVGIVGEYAKSPRWQKHLRIFQLFVMIGVAGELIADGGVFLFSHRLQTTADAKIAALNSAAAQLQRDAALLFDLFAALVFGLGRSGLKVGPGPPFTKGSPLSPLGGETPWDPTDEAPIRMYIGSKT
jgi:hypothetical protein